MGGIESILATLRAHLGDVEALGVQRLGVLSAPTWKPASAMLRDPKVYLQDILEAIDLIGQFVADESREEFLADQKTRAAVVRELEVIGEATKALPEEVRS